MAVRKWTTEQKQWQREAIRRWKPWEQSAGPRSAEGKWRVARNAWRGGQREKLRELVRLVKRAIIQARELATKRF